MPDPFRLQTTSGVRYSLLEGYPTFGVDRDGHVTAVEKYRLLAVNMEAFIQDVFPAPSVLSQFFTAGNRRRMPGNDLLITRDVQFEPQDMSKPMDPYGNDSAAPVGTYGEYVLATINYETVKSEDDEEQDPRNPETFLTHSVNCGGEFLALSSPNSKWENIANPNGIDQVSENPDFMDPANLPGANVPAGEIEPNKDFQIPRTLVIPTIEHTLSWREVINPPWQSIRACLGKVNDRQDPLLFHAPPETVLFLGVSGKQEFTARPGVPIAYRKPWSLDFKFSEKHFEDWVYIDAGGVILRKVTQVVTWNHFWRGEKNRFEILLDRDEKRAYGTVNMRAMFLRGVTA